MKEIPIIPYMDWWASSIYHETMEIVKVVKQYCRQKATLQKQLQNILKQDITHKIHRVQQTG